MAENKIRDKQAKVIPLVKARVVGEGGESGSNLTDVEGEDLNAIGGLLHPPYDPDALIDLLEISNALRQNVDAMATNIDGFGHRFDTTIDPDAESAHDDVAAAIWRQRVRDAEIADDLPDDLQNLTPEKSEVEAELDRIREVIRLEEMRLEMFFRYCCDEMSFVALRRNTRQDIELLGNAWWEVLRDRDGQIVQFVYVPGVSMRLTKVDDEPVDVEVKRQSTPLSWETAIVRKRFRRHVQVVQGATQNKTVFFKEFGDPRVISAKTGKAYRSEEELRREESDAPPATEVLHFRCHNPRGAYGIPRWIGTLLSVLGSREAEEVNLMYFENKSVPPLAITVSGGRITDETVERVQSFIQNKIRGKENFHNIMILEAEDADPDSGDATGKAQIKIQPLTNAQQKDALFQEYDDRNIDKVGMAFRLPRLLRGDIRDFNRATAEAALEFAEMQVFQPEREDFDWIMNRKVLTALGVKYHTFRSNAPATKDPAKMSEIVTALVKAGVVTPEEGRIVARDILNVDLEEIDAAWVKQPLELTKAGVPVGEGGAGAAPVEEEDPLGLLEEEPTEGEEEPADEVAQRLGGSSVAVRRLARRLLRLRDQMNREEIISARNAFLDAKDQLGER